MPPERSRMRIYISDGRVYADFDETIEVCKSEKHLDTLQKYKDALIEKISNIFDWTVTEAALKGMETASQKPAKRNEDAEAVSKHSQNVSEPQKTETNQLQELFRAPKDVIKPPETKKTRQKLDYGKIMALHNAGWNNQKIADEMGMTYAAVATAISTYKKKMGGGKA